MPSRRSSASLLRTSNKRPSNEKACGAGHFSAVLAMKTALWTVAAAWRKGEKSVLVRASWNY